MPRSRTAWLANFFTYGPSFCYHEGLRYFESVGHLLVALVSETGYVMGDAEPALTLLADDVIEHQRFFNLVYVLRNKEDSLKSSKDAYRDYPQVDVESLLERSHSGLERLRLEAPGFELAYESLDDEGVMATLYGAILPQTPFPVARYRMLRDLNVTQNFARVGGTS